MMVSRTPSNGNSGSAENQTSKARHVLRVLFRHKRKMAIFFSATMALVVLGIALWPRSYVSDARLFVRMGRESVSLDPTATLNQNVDIEGSREHEINSELEILRGRVLLEDVVDRLGVHAVLGTSPDDESSWNQAVMVPLMTVRDWLLGGISDKERAISRLEKSIVVASPRKSHIIMIKCTATDPHLAQSILQGFLDSYRVRHLQANRTAGSYEFFVEQSDLLRDQLQQATAELREAKNKSVLVSINGQQENVQAQLNAIEIAMQANNRALASSEAKIAALTEALGQLPEQLMAEETETPNSAADAMRNELYKLQILEKEASSRGTSEHPRVIALRRQVAEMEKILDQQVGRRSHTTRKLSPVHQDVQTELMAAKAQAAAQRAEARMLEEQHAAVQNKVQTVNTSEFHIAELTRKVELTEANYRAYSNNREQARIDQALESGRISNVNVVQPASLVERPASPMARLSLAMGFLVATLGAIGLAFAAEMFDPSVKTPEQFEHELGIPVLFSVPRGTRQTQLQN